MNTVEKPKTAGVWVYDVLRAKILNGDLQPGAMLRQGELAEELDVSRMPIREAIRKLSSEGWVEDRPNRMSVVTELDAEDARELFLIRAQLEKLALALSVPRLTQTDHAALGEAHRELQESGAESYTEKHRTFHMSLYVRAGQRLRNLISHHLDQSERYLRFEISFLEVSPEDQAEHRALFEAVTSRQVEEAQTILQPHVADAGEDIARAIQARFG